MKAKIAVLVLIFASAGFLTYHHFAQDSKPENALEILYINNNDSEELKNVKAAMLAINAMVSTKLELPINLTILEVKNGDEYLIKRNTIMLSDNPPDIIVAGTQPLADLEKMGALMPLEGNIESLDQVYDSLSGTHTVAFGFHIKSAVINKKLLERMDLTMPTPDWMDEDVVELVSALKSKQPGMNLFLTKALYETYFNCYLGDLIEKKMAGDIADFTLSDPEFLSALDEMNKEIKKSFDLSSMPNQQARINMIFEPKSQEFLKQQRDIEDNMLNNVTVVESINAMNAVTMTKIYQYTDNLVLLPIGNKMETLRFGINARTKHPEVAKDFVNRALSWDSQFKFALFSDKVKYAQVNKDNECRLLAYGEAFASDSNVVDIRNAVIEKLNNKEYTDLGEMDAKERVARDELLRTTFNVIFDPKLSEEKFQYKELQIVQDRIKLMILE